MPSESPAHPSSAAHLSIAWWQAVPGKCAWSRLCAYPGTCIANHGVEVVVLLAGDPMAICWIAQGRSFPRTSCLAWRSTCEGRVVAAHDLHSAWRVWPGSQCMKTREQVYIHSKAHALVRSESLLARVVTVSSALGRRRGNPVTRNGFPCEPLCRNTKSYRATSKPQRQLRQHTSTRTAYATSPPLLNSNTEQHPSAPQQCRHSTKKRTSMPSAPRPAMAKSGSYPSFPATICRRWACQKPPTCTATSRLLSVSWHASSVCVGNRN